MMSRFSIFISVGAVIATFGCLARPLPPSVTAEEIDAVVPTVAAQKIDDLIEDNTRLLDIQYALTTASAKRCGALSRPQSGLLLSRAKFFEDDSLRESMSREYSLGENLGVVYVVPGGSFDLAGIRVGDQLLELDGQELRTSDEFRKLMLETSDRRSIELLAGRDGEQFETTIPLQLGCPVVFKTIADFNLTTRQPMRLLVGVPVGILRYIEDNDTLAMVLAHQFAHALFDDDTKPWPEQETLADRYGLQLAVGAGFDVSGAIAYWETVAKEYPWLIDEALEMKSPVREGYRGYTHFGIGNRLAAIRATVAEIEVRRAELPESH